MIIDAALSEEIDAFPDAELDTELDEDKAKLPILNAAKNLALYKTGWEKIKIDARRICRIYGTCAIKISYVRETRRIKERLVVKGDDGHMIAYKEKWDYPYDDIMLEVIDNPRRFLMDNNVRDIDDIRAEDCALYTEVSWNAYKQKVQHNRFYKNVEFVKPGADYSFDVDGNIVPPDERGGDEPERNVKLLEYWNQKTDEYLVIANGVLIRQTPLADDHKTLPFAVMHMYRRPHTYYSKGVPKLIESIEAAYNKMMNATTQATGLAFPVLLTSEDAGIDPRQYAPYPGMVLEGAMDKVKLEQLGSVPSEVYQYAEKLEAWLIWVTGVNYQQIFSPLGESDRVGIESLKKESMLARINANLRENEANFITRLVDLLVQNIQQYYSAPRIRPLLSSDNLKDIPDEKIVTDKETGEIRGILEDRKIPIEAGVKFSSVENKDKGVFTLKAELSDEKSFILARPEFIRTKSKIIVRAVRPSAMGSSKEAKKLMFQELIGTALDTNSTVSQLEEDPETGAPGPPVWDIRYLSTRLAESFELPTDKAIVTPGDDEEPSAVRALQEDSQTFVDTFNNNAVEFPLEQEEGVIPGFEDIPPEEQGEFVSTIA